MGNVGLKKFWSHKIRIYRKSEGVDDSHGGKTKSWEKLYWDIPCRIMAARGSGRVEVQMSGVLHIATHLVNCDLDVDIRSEDKVFDQNGRILYLVLGANDIFRGNKVHHKEGVLERLNQ